MIKNKDSLKAKINNLAFKTNIPHKYILQNYMFESLLKRLSKSIYKDKFIIKGGFLLTSIFGVNLRSTMDLDTTIKGISLDRETITKVINEIINIDINDNIKLELENIKDIRIEDDYPGFNINIKADFEGLKTNLMIDITVGDIITYKEVEYRYKTLFENDIIDIMSYNYETIISEKFNTIIARNINNTRMKDYYDIYMFVNLKLKEINRETLRNAIINTAKSKKDIDYIINSNKYIELIENDNQLKLFWHNYQNNYEYAKDITFEDTIKAIKTINDILKENK